MPWQEYFGAEFDGSQPSFCVGLADYAHPYGHQTEGIGNHPEDSWSFRTSDSKCVWNGVWCRKDGACTLWDDNNKRCDSLFTFAGEKSQYTSYYHGTTGCVPPNVGKTHISETTLNTECASAFQNADICYDNAGAVVTCGGGSMKWKFTASYWVATVADGASSEPSVNGGFKYASGACVQDVVYYGSPGDLWEAVHMGCPPEFAQDNSPNTAGYYPGPNCQSRRSDIVGTRLAVSNWGTGAVTLTADRHRCYETPNSFHCPPDGHYTGSGSGTGLSCVPDVADPSCPAGYTFYGIYSGLTPYVTGSGPACIKEYAVRQGSMSLSDYINNRYYTLFAGNRSISIRCGDIREWFGLAYYPQGSPFTSPYDWAATYSRAGGMLSPIGQRTSGSNIETGVVYNTGLGRYTWATHVMDVHGGYAVLFFHKSPNEWHYVVLKEGPAYTWSAKDHQFLCYGERTLGRPQLLPSKCIKFFTYSMPSTATNPDTNTAPLDSDLMEYESTHIDLSSGIITWNAPTTLKAGVGAGPAINREHTGDIFYDKKTGKHIRAFMQFNANNVRYDDAVVPCPHPPCPDLTSTWYMQVRNTDGAWSPKSAFPAGLPSASANFRRTPDGRLWYGNHYCSHFDMETASGTWI